MTSRWHLYIPFVRLLLNIPPCIYLFTTSVDQRVLSPSFTQSSIVQSLGIHSSECNPTRLRLDPNGSSVSFSIHWTSPLRTKGIFITSVGSKTSSRTTSALLLLPLSLRLSRSPLLEMLNTRSTNKIAVLWTIRVRDFSLLGHLCKASKSCFVYENFWTHMAYIACLKIRFKRKYPLLFLKIIVLMAQLILFGIQG